MNNICMLQHSKIVMLSLHNWVFLLSPLYAHAWYAQKDKEYAKKIKRKKNQNAFKYGCKCDFRRCGSYRMYLEGGSPHQEIMIMYECIWFSRLSNHHNMRNLCTLVMFFTHNTYTLCYFWYICRYNVIWPSQGIHVLIYAY